MKPESLLASAAINIGIALIILTLFSILKKQPSNAPIYYARRVSKRHQIRFDHSLTLSRLLPSVSWISRAFRITEDQILDTHGLDALIIIRLFKFGLTFFVVSSLVGLLILAPINYYGQDEPSSGYYTLDSFSISNVRRGSNRLWVHFTCLLFISFYGCYLLHKGYSEILVKRIQQLHNLRHRPDQFTVQVRQIPFCVEHNARGCNVQHFFYKHYPHSYHSYRILYDEKDLQDLLNQVKLIGKKMEGLREKSRVAKHNEEPLIYDTSREDALKIALHEEKLQEVCQKIQKLQGENILKELSVAFVTFKSRQGAALAAQSQQHSHPLLWVTEMAPEPRDVSWRNLTIPYRMLPVCKIGVILAASLLTIFFAIPVTAVQGIAKFEKLKKWFPPARAIQLIPGLSSVVTGYLPSAILNGFIYIVPFAMLALAKLGGSISKSKEEIKACNMVFYFLVGNVFFLSLISGSLLDEITEFFSHPKTVPSHLATAVSAQADFFMTYILTDGLSGFSFEILQAGLLLWDCLQSHTCGRGKEKNPYLYSLPYFRIIPVVCLSILVGLVYAVVTPLLLPFLVGYFCLGYVVYVNQIEDVYETIYDTYGQYWPYVHHYIFVGIILMQITMIGLFGLKSKPAALIATIPLLLFTIMFNEYCKIRFLPSFRHFSIQNAVENDELDEKSGQMESNYGNAINAYCQPCLRPVNLMASKSSFMDPLLSS
ncbi:DUF221 domain-containing protein/RSN1_TM domain-containing protein, partial [Cephalotus follicularis]